MLTGPNLKATSAKEVVALTMKDPNKLNASIAATGSINHLVTEMFKFEAKAPFASIPYKGGAQAVTDAISGQVDMIFVTLSSVASFISSGQLRPLAIASQARNPKFQLVPAMACSRGFPVHRRQSRLNGMVEPAGTDEAIIDRLNTELEAVLAQPEVKERFATLGMTAVGGNPQWFESFLPGGNETLGGSHSTRQHHRRITTWN